jgi:hypothetical protein
MAIDSHSIDTDITLELDEDDITISEFATAFEHFAGLVREVAKAIAPRRKPIWLVKIYPGSAGIGFYPKAGAFAADELATVRSAVLSGIEILDQGKRPTHFTDKAIDHARLITGAFKARQRPPRLRIWNRNEKSAPLRPAILETAAQLLEANYEDEGSVEGTLEVLSGHGKFEVMVYDPLDGRAIKCELDQQYLRTALDSFMKRVEVFGKVRYRRDGIPVSVKVERIEAFPTREEIPLLDEIRGILKE